MQQVGLSDVRSLSMASIDGPRNFVTGVRQQTGAVWQ